jgi:hypothetical protein
VSGQFVSPDGVQGNAQGMDPYAYVEGNPETRTDPTGHCDGWCWAANIAGALGTVAFIAGTVIAAGALITATAMTAPVSIPALAVLGITVGAGVGGAWLGGVMSNGGFNLSDRSAQNTLIWEAIGLVGGLFGGVGDSIAAADNTLTGNALFRDWVGSYVMGNLTAFGDMATNPSSAGGLEITSQDVQRWQDQQDAESAKEMHMSVKQYRAWWHKLAVKTQQQRDMWTRSYATNWHSWLSTHGSATPRQEAINDMWRNAYQAMMRFG